MKDRKLMSYTEKSIKDSLLVDYIKSAIRDSISVKEDLLRDEVKLQKLAEIGNKIHKTVTNGKKVLICGNGGSAADAQHIAAEIVGRFVIERKGLAAIAMTTDSSILTAIGNDYGFNAVFERQVEALGTEGDILIGITTSGNSANVLAALKKAQKLGLTTVALLGGNGGEAANICDYSIVANSNITARIQESHILCGHILCGIIDEIIVRESESSCKAIFLDRDKTIIEDEGYSHDTEKIKFLDGAIEALHLLQEAGYKLIITTNQSGVGRGYFSHEEAVRYNAAVVDMLKDNGVTIDNVQMCPHSPEESCICRKPSPYMVDLAATQLNIDVAKSYMLGDKLSDIKCGENADVKASYLVTEEENLLYWAKRIINEDCL